MALQEDPAPGPDRRRYTLTLTNNGAADFLPTATPDRHLTVTFRLLDGTDQVVREEVHRLRRRILWRPFIVELRDTRLPRHQPRTYTFTTAGRDAPAALEAVVRYHLLDEKRLRRIGYDNQTPIAYEVFQRRIELPGG